MAIAREAISLLDDVTGYVDESSGAVGDAAAELLAAHLAACLPGCGARAGVPVRHG